MKGKTNETRPLFWVQFTTINTCLVTGAADMVTGTVFPRQGDNNKETQRTSSFEGWKKAVL